MSLSLYYEGQSLEDMVTALRRNYLTTSGWMESADSKLSTRDGRPLPWFTYAAIDFLERTLARADTVVFVDLALWQHYWGATRRQIECLFRPREGFPTNCPMYQKALATVPRIRAIHRRGRPRFLELTALAERRGKRFVHLKTRGEMKRELARVARLAGRRPAS